MDRTTEFTMFDLIDSSVLITGTDTSVGKTHITCKFLREWQHQGIRVAPFKPIECGEDRSDATALLHASGSTTLSLDDINPQWFRLPAAPWTAAAAEGRSIDTCTILDHFEALSTRYDRILVEGAGGWEVPISGELTLANLAREFALPVVVVAADRLGVINHTLLTVKAIETTGLTCKGVILNAIPDCPPDPKLKNLEQLQTFLGKNRVVTHPIC